MSGSTKSFIVHSMPVLLRTKVTRPDPDDTSRRIIDESWYRSIREKMAILFAFYCEQGLVNDISRLTAAPLDDVELRIEDFTREGQEFVLTGATSRWLASFDRTPQKSPSNVDMLAKALAKLRSAT